MSYVQACWSHSIAVHRALDFLGQLSSWGVPALLPSGRSAALRVLVLRFATTQSLAKSIARMSAESDLWIL